MHKGREGTFDEFKNSMYYYCLTLKKKYMQGILFFLFIAKYGKYKIVLSLFSNYFLPFDYVASLLSSEVNPVFSLLIFLM